MISKSQLVCLSEDLISHIISNGSVKKLYEIQGTTAGLKSDIAAAGEHRGKLGLGAGALGTLYLMKKGSGKTARELGQELKKGAEETTSAIKGTIKKAME